MNQETLPFYMIGVIASIIGIVIFLTVSAAKKRAENLKKYAVRIGFNYSEKPSNPITNDFNLFKKGRSRKSYNIMKGSRNGIPLTIFDYRYTTGGGKNSHTYIQTVIIAEPEKNIPKFTLTPENFLHKIGSAFGYKDIDFDNYPIFSKRYFLRGENDTTIRQLFRPELLNYFERQKKRASIESNSKTLLYYFPSKKTKPEELNKFIEEFNRVIGMFN
jgi:hypothetical protein